MDLKGKVAFVSGGTRGIGRAVAEKLAEHGANVVISFFRSRQNAAEAQEKIESLGVKCVTCRVNMANMEQVPTIFEGIRQEFGKLDILISNAAMGTFTEMLNIDRKSWELSMHTNARAFLQCLQLGVPLMPENGRIVALSSLGSTRYIPGYAAIGVSKAAIENMVRYSAIELAPRNITVNCVAGGFIDTDALKVFPNYQHLLDEVIQRTPFKRIGQPAEVANVVVFLAG
ncbi:MAG TPA: SDR family oxidoreductase, partial [Candidatus Deferrimicrobium sp.]|nr:SDR family oxidoreductase [Candidatus Deferrimicrobium sp.]